MKRLDDFAKCIYSTRGEKMDGAPSGVDWSISVVDALIAHEIACAASDDASPSKYVAGLLQLIEERAAEWLPGIKFEHEKTK